MTSNRTLDDETITTIVQHIEPNWTVRAATPATAGSHIVYHLTVETPDGGQHCVLKATQPDADPVCDDEARMLAILDAHATLPVPNVLGVVDDHPDLPTPLFLAGELPGANDDRTALTDYTLADVQTLGRSTGRYLAALHDLDAVDAYGFVGVDPIEQLSGGRPSADRSQIAVENPTRGWIDYLDAERDRIVEALDATPFDEFAAEMGPALDAHIEGLSGTFDPVVARIDQSLDNVLVDADTREVTGLLDWDFCVAATPDYDIEFVAESLSGGHWTLLPDAPNHRDDIRTAVLDGYRDAGGDAVVEQFHQNRPCYELLNTVHMMLNFEPWFDTIGLGAPTAEEKAAAADALRGYARTLLADT